MKKIFRIILLPIFLWPISVSTFARGSLIIYDSTNKINVLVKNGIGSQIDEFEVIDINSSKLGSYQLENFDVILPIGSSATKYAVAATDSVPIVFSLVAGPKFFQYQHKLNVTGVSMDIGAEEFYKVLSKIIPQGSSIGLIYKSDLSHYLSYEIEFVESKYGFKSIRRKIETRAEMGPVFKEMVIKHKIKAFWMFSDSLYNEAIFKKLAHVCKKYNVLLITSFESLVEQAGAAFAIAPSYFEMGIQAGEMTNEILDGKKVSSLVIQSPRKTGVYINEETIAALNITLPQELLNRTKVTQLFSQAQAAYNKRAYNRAQRNLGSVLKLDRGHVGAKTMLRKINAQISYAQGKKLLDAGSLEKSIKYFIASAPYSAEARVQLRHLRNKLKLRINSMVKAGIRAYEKRKYQLCVNQMRTVLYIEPGHARAKAYLVKGRQRLRALKALR